VTVATATQRAVPYEIEASGTVEPVASADVTAQVGGLVIAIPLREGADVAAGTTLVQLDSRPFGTAVAQAAAVLARDRARARTARLALERAETLARQGLLASGELDDTRANAEALAATALADSADLARARLDLAYATIRAPIAGRTGKLNVHVGDVVRANDPTSPVVTIHQLHPIRVRFTIPQSEFETVRGERRSAVQVLVNDGGSDSSWTEGRLAFVDNQVDASTGTLLLKGEFSNRDNTLWPGAFARVRLRLREQGQATVVPASAVGNSQNGAFLWVVKPDTTVEMRSITVPRTWNGLAVVTSGVKPGETVVTDGQNRLTPGARAIIRVPQDAGGGAAGPRRAGKRP
jgi:multidrug efflux system membrane fusion protein